MDDRTRMRSDQTCNVFYWTDSYGQSHVCGGRRDVLQWTIKLVMCSIGWFALDNWTFIFKCSIDYLDNGMSNGMIERDFGNRFFKINYIFLIL